jgi:hypothetical protein
MATASSRKRPARKYSVASYHEQRQRIPAEELAKHNGKWAAFSRDGKRVLASGTTLAALEKKLRAAGRDPLDAVYEFVGEEDSVVTGAQFL